jgi:invasion protein IalB
MTSSKNTGRLPITALVAVAAIILPSTFAQARSHHKKAAEKAQAASTAPALVGTFGDWSVYKAQSGKSKVCYALAQPTDRSPASLKKVAAHVFISNRPAENVHNEISVITGVALKEGAADSKASLGSSSFDLLSKGENAFVKNAADEKRFIETMKKGGKLTVKIALLKGGLVTDTYALSGIGQALAQATKECQ